MNLEALASSIDLAGQTGHTVSLNESLILQNSLLILKNENHFRKVFFWGRILGSENDYYIAFGYVNDALFGRRYYYSRDCINWGLLPQPTPGGKQLTPFCTTRFQGDPSLVIDVLIDKEETNWICTLRKPQIFRLKEEDRLSATVHLINQEAAMAPRGALFKRPDGVIVENISFEGLKEIEAREFKSYLHYRKPTQKWNTNLLYREDYNYAMDFLDPIDIELPEDCWVVTFSAGDTIVGVKSLHWPGFFFYHYLETPRYGFIYIGHGKKCLDVPFLLFPS